MNKLWIIVKHEYLTDIRAKSFWITTFVMPVLMVAFGGFIGYMAAESDTLLATSNPLASPDSEMTGWGVAGMMVGILMTMFIMIYGAQIFNKVKTEKCNRIMEVLATCVDGRTMMLAKIVSVALVGLTQMGLWALIIFAIVGVMMVMTGTPLPMELLTDPHLYASLLWGAGFFVGGYIFFGSMFAATGAMTDKNQENQEYMTVLTFILLGSFYIGQFSADNINSPMTEWCRYIPFTSATVGAIGAIGGEIPVWKSLLSLLSLYVFAGASLMFAGKLYRSVLLLKGKRLTPRDVITFLRTR